MYLFIFIYIRVEKKSWETKCDATVVVFFVILVILRILCELCTVRTYLFTLVSLYLIRR